MNKRLLFTLISSMALLFAGCSNSDNDPKPGPEPEPPTPITPVEVVSGAYKGTLDITMAGAPIASDITQKVTISKAATGTDAVKLELKNFSFEGMNIGDIVIDQCTVTEKEGTYSFTGEQNLVLVVGPCPVKIAGTVKDKKISIDIDVTVTAMGNVAVKAKFDGDKLAGTESSEAKITAMTFASKVVVDQPVIDEAKGLITFRVNDDATDEELKALVPTITISAKATISPAADKAQDFAAGKTVTYTVSAEDGTSKAYVASAIKTALLKYSFEEWEAYGTAAELPLPRKELASSSQGAALLSGYGKGVPMYKSEDKKEGQYAAKLYTVDLAEFANALVPAITSGTVYTGSFDMMAAFTDRLMCTQFGIPYAKKPVSLRGWYKYTPGEKFLDGSDPDNIVEVEGKIDECSIQAVLYTIESEDEFLNGHNISNSDKIVAVAALEDGTAKSEYTYFDLPFTFLEGKTYDSEAKYKIAIICSSSKEGDTFNGAGGSTLMVDELEVLGE